MLALRSVLAIRVSDAAAATAARTSVADAVLLDLAAPASSETRATARKTVAQSIDDIGATGRTVLARVSAAGSGELAADLAAVVGPRLAAVVLSGTELPQDVRDADVLLRKYEMRDKIAPGAIRLIPEIDSATGLQSLPAILDAVDRHDAVALNLAHLNDNLGLGAGFHETRSHFMAMLAVSARSADLPWLLGTFDATRSLIDATRAHELGAAGAVIHSEASARGTNSLFNPDPAAVAAARAVIKVWARLHEEGSLTGVAQFGDETLLVDRRAMRHARLVVATADGVAARQRVNNPTTATGLRSRSTV
jgi:citrate lyase subunit beta/citryl-CoA lyase